MPVYTPLPVKAVLDLWTDVEFDLHIGGNFAYSPAGQATAKGEMFIGTGVDTFGLLSAGSDTQIVESDSTQTTGMKNSWAFVPVGGIILWSGLLGALPANWQLCNGSNGTPDLRDRFVIGAGSTYAVGATGGSSTGDLEHNHGGTYSTASEGGHIHSQGNTDAGSAHKHMVFLDELSSGVDAEDNGYATHGTIHIHYSYSGNESSHTHTKPDFNTATHTHTIAIDNQLGVMAMLPPYYALAYIQRLS